MAPDGTFAYVTPSCERITGYSAGDFYKKSSLFYEIIHPDDTAAYNKHRELSLDSTGPESVEFRIVRKDGGIRWISHICKPMFGRNGELLGRRGSNRDETERKRVEEALQKSEEKFRGLFEYSRDGIVIADAKTLQFVDNNQMFSQMVGYSPEEIKNLSVPDIHPEDALSHVLEEFKKIASHEVDIARNLPVKRKNGTIFYADISSYPINIFNKDCQVGVFRDITERKLMDETLMESKTLVDAVVENVPLMIFLKEATDLRFVIFNRAGEELLGYDRQVLLGKNNLDLFPPEQAAHFMTKDREVLDGDAGMLDIPEEPIMTAKKGLRMLHTRKVCIRGADGTTKFLLGISEDITERIQAEEVIRSREEQFRAIFHNQQTGLIMVDAVTHIISDANVAALSMIGASREEVIGKICHIFICPAEQGKCPVTDLGHTVDNSERVLIRANGERIPILKSVNPVKIGGRLFLIESFVDLTERKQMERALHESRQLFADIISFLPDPTFVIDKDGKVLAWNRAIEQLSGVSAGAMIGKGKYEYSLWEYGKRRPILIDLVLHPDQVAGRLDYTDIHVDGHTVTAQTEIVPTGISHTISLLLVASPLVDAQGNITGAIESIRDVSRLKDTEAELARINQNLEEIVQVRTQLLAESERKYRTLFDKTKDAYLIIENNKFVDCNAATLEMLGYKTKEELFQTHPSSLSPPTQPDGRPSFEKAEEMMAIALRDGSNRFEWVHRRANGEDFWVEVSLTAIPIQDHQVIHTAWRDITDRKKAEAEIRASLEEKVILLREVHHRVKNNLQIIISLVSLQMRQTDNPVVKQILSETQNRVRAMSLVHEKLYRSGSLSHIDFADYTRFLATQLFSFYDMDTRRVRLDFAMEKIPLDINTAIPLGLLMNELISNSLRHAFPDGRDGTISISGRYEGNLIMLVVRDNGIGIPKELDWKSTTSLGMQLVTSLVDQVAGTITLDRENGTLFTITVNRASHQEEPDDMHIRANRG
jgi:PAS domain S-box-containing protein